jgi:aryl-alcohol dehydrogenase-like predicted oxidoreductase
MIEMPYSLIDRAYRQMLLWARSRSISTMVYGALGDGILAGAYREAPDFSDPADTRAGYAFFREPGFSKCMTLLETIQAIAARRNQTAAEVTINWTRQDPAVTTVILGTGKKKHAEHNCQALDWELTGEELAQITKAADDTVGTGVNSRRFYDVR